MSRGRPLEVEQELVESFRRCGAVTDYLIQHDAHHRDQICTLARDLGHEFEPDDMMRVWGWKALPKR